MKFVGLRGNNGSMHADQSVPVTVRPLSTWEFCTFEPRGCHATITQNIMYMTTQESCPVDIY